MAEYCFQFSWLWTNGYLFTAHACNYLTMKSFSSDCDLKSFLGVSVFFDILVTRFLQKQKEIKLRHELILQIIRSCATLGEISDGVLLL